MSTPPTTRRLLGRHIPPQSRGDVFRSLDNRNARPVDTKDANPRRLPSILSACRLPRELGTGSAPKQDDAQHTEHARRIGRSATTVVVVLSVDVMALAVSRRTTGPFGLFGYEYLAAAIAALALAGTYRLRFSLRLSDDMFRILAAITLSFLVVAPALHDARSRVLTLVVTAALVLLGRAASYGLVTLLRQNGVLAERTLIIGSGEVGTEIVQILQDQPEYGLVTVGILDVGHDSANGFDASTVREVVHDLTVERVIVAYGRVPDATLVSVLRGCRSLPVRIHVVPRFFELGVSYGGRHADDLCGFPILRLGAGVDRRAARVAKRLFDIVAGSALLVLSGPVLVATAAAVRLSSPGPVLFRQVRIGDNGRIIKISKFRTLLCNDDSDRTWSVAEDDRRTYVGRFLRRTGLDELPQLINVIRGDMSLIGPRPERPYFAGRFSAEIPGYADRQRVPQGITGWAQVHGLRGDTPIPDRVRLDNYYIEHWTVWRDLQILARTVAAVVRRRGA
jgi:exopolysaccharide biosynthesis polyprenyl glycosylphosphotransferase